MTAGRGLSLLLAAGLGAFASLSAVTVFYARGASYLGNDPKTCMNCHVMREQFDSWGRSSHARAAVCNDCHTPHSIVGKYAVKGLNGFNHSVAFTTQRFPEPIVIRALNRRIALENCVRCHGEMVSRTAGPADARRGGNGRGNGRGGPGDCVSCHGNVGHSGRF